MRPNECTLMKLSINHHALEAGHQPADTHTNRDVYLNTDGVSENRLFIKYISRNLLILLLILFSKMNYQGNACESVSVCECPWVCERLSSFSLWENSFALGDSSRELNGALSLSPRRHRHSHSHLLTTLFLHFSNLTPVWVYHFPYYCPVCHFS